MIIKMSLKLSQNIASYICHEMANSIGALDGNMEFLDSDNPYQKDALDIIRHASRHLVSRVRYLRALYGSKTTSSSLGEIMNLAAEVFVDTRSLFNFNIPELKNADLNDLDAKLLLAFIQIAHSDMPFYGSIEVNVTLVDSGYKIKVSSVSSKIRTKDNLYQILNNADVEQSISPANVVAYYVRQLSQEPQKYKILINPGKVDYIFYAKIL